MRSLVRATVGAAALRRCGVRQVAYGSSVSQRLLRNRHAIKIIVQVPDRVCVCVSVCLCVHVCVRVSVRVCV